MQSASPMCVWRYKCEARFEQDLTGGGTGTGFEQIWPGFERRIIGSLSWLELNLTLCSVKDFGKYLRTSHPMITNNFIKIL